MAGSINILQGDITELHVDAIVNAANKSLLGGGGVDGAIHRAAGPELKAYNKTLGGCETGEAKLSPGFNLKAKHVISTVGPVWKDGTNGEEQLLANCYTNSLELARQNNLRSIAFPAISTGVYGFPFDKATVIAIETINDFLRKDVDLKVTLVFFSDRDFQEASEILQSLNS